MKYLYLFILASLLTSCADMGLVERENCYGKDRVQHTPAGYPCECCPIGR